MPKPLSKAAIKRIKRAATYNHETYCYDGPRGQVAPRHGFYAMMRREDIVALAAHAGIDING